MMKKSLAALIVLGISLLGISTPASATSSLTAGGTTITWDPSTFYEPSGCSQYKFNYSQTSSVLLADIQILNKFGDNVGSTIIFDSGSKNLQICSSSYSAQEGPFRLVLESTATGGGGSSIAETYISFLSRSGGISSITLDGPTTAQPGSSARISVTLRDASGSPVAGQVVTYSGLGPGFLTSSSSISDAQGKIDIVALFGPSDSGKLTITVSAGTLSKSIVIKLGSFSSSPANPNVAHLEGHGPYDGEFSAWTKVLANGTQMKFYAKYLQPGQKVQFMVQNSSGVYEQVAWKRVTAGDLADDGAYTNLQNHVYFIRTIDLKPGKNRVRILVDGEIVWGTKTYSLK